MENVPRIQVPLDELNVNRVRHITELFRPIASRQGKIITRPISMRNSLIFGISDTYQGGTDYLDWRFKTKVESFSGMYYERWLPYENNIYYLERTYFHLYKTDYIGIKSDEYILLHCDVNEPNDAEHARFKQSPHLHFSFAEQPIPHSHIALNNGNLSEVLSSLASLQTALKQAVDMLYEQILIPIKKVQSGNS